VARACLDALRTYADAAAGRQSWLESRLATEVEDTSLAATDLETAEKLSLLGERNPAAFGAIADELRKDGARSAPLGSSALYLLTLHPPLLDEYREAVSEIQRTAVELADLREAAALDDDTGATIERLASLAARHSELSAGLKRRLAVAAAQSESAAA
jgi:hypothetical protein